MNFTKENINEAHEKYTGVEFPKLVNEFKKMGISKNEFNIQIGLRFYTNIEGTTIELPGVKVIQRINPNSSIENAKKILKRHQAGDTDFLTFCEEIAMAGIYKWVIDPFILTCDYYDLNESIVLSEKIPQT